VDYRKKDIKIGTAEKVRRFVILARKYMAPHSKKYDYLYSPPSYTHFT
jgi:hypothetical protein